MHRENEILENYIKNILFHPEKAELDPESLSEENQSLGQWLLKLGKWVMEARKFADAMAEGSGENYDNMVLELQKRASALENERNLFVKFTESARERIIVLDEETGEMVYANRIAREFFEKTSSYIDTADDINQKSGCSYQNTYSEWLHVVEHPEEDGNEDSDAHPEAAAARTEYYQVHSLYIIWEGRGAVAHMFSNVTEQKEIESLAMKDSLTSALSRTYAMEYLNRLFSEEKYFSLAFVDVDYLKFCNDTFGHSAGDEYLREVVQLLQEIEQSIIVCRTGGDEFMAISEHLSLGEMEKRIEKVRQKLCGEYFEGSTIHKNFSYGLASRTNDSVETLQQILSDADERMYQNKLENKKNNHMSIRDSRMG